MAETQAQRAEGVLEEDAIAAAAQGATQVCCHHRLAHCPCGWGRQGQLLLRALIRRTVGCGWHPDRLLPRHVASQSDAVFLLCFRPLFAA